MQTPNVRYLVLIVLLLLGGSAYALLGRPAQVGEPRWPAEDAVFATASWEAGPAVQSRDDTTDVVTRTLRSSSGRSASLTIFSSQAPKLYASGAEVPFLGNGYTVEQAPPALVPFQLQGIETLVAKRGNEQWLVLHAYGERRGLLGNGINAWTLALLDGLAATPNDYYKLYLMLPADRVNDAAAAQEVAALVDTLFPRIAAWYAA
jgi:hypothetical protein